MTPWQDARCGAAGDVTAGNGNCSGSGQGARHHALSVDVEDWYHDGEIPLRDPPGERVEANTLRLLELFEARGARATFFFLGEVAERFPGLVRRVAAAGHELASHGFRHRPVPALARAELREDVTRSLRVLEDIAGVRAVGYRAPYFSIRAGVADDVEVLRESGVEYDSSVLATRGRSGGLRLLHPRGPFRHRNGLLEIPVAMLRLGGLWYLPVASAGGLRVLGVERVDRLLSVFEREVGAAVFYAHPWEFDPQSPTAPLPGRWILRVGRAGVAQALRELLGRIRFAPIRETFAGVLQGEGPVGAQP